MGTLKMPLSRAEFDAVLTTARDLDGETGGHFGGRSYERAFLWFARTGMHPVCMTHGWQPPPRVVEEDGVSYVEWRRAKKSLATGLTRILLSKALASWAVEWLSLPRPYERHYWNDLFRTLGRAAVQRHPDLPAVAELAPMTLRHTAAISLLRCGVHPEIIRQVLNVSAGVLSRYTRMYPKEMADTLAKVGW